MTTTEYAEPTETHEHWPSEEYDPHHDVFEHEDNGRVPWRLRAFLTIPVLEVLAQGFSQDEGTKSIFVAPMFLLTLLLAGFDLIYQARLRSSAHPISMRHWTMVALWLGGIGVYAIARAVSMANEAYYIAADVYHWYLEFVGVGFLGVWACSNYSSAVIARSFSKAFFVLGVIGIGVFVMGMTGYAVGGGKDVENLAFWRLELGRGYPLIPLIIVVSAFLYAPRPQGRFPWATVLAGGLLLIGLICTLKRTQWLLFPVCVAGLLLPKKVMTASPFFIVLAGALLWAFNYMSPSTIPNAIENAKAALTYNDKWTVDKTLDTREAQVDAAFEATRRIPSGHGFGASIAMTTPNGQRVEKLHYVHSLYAYYALQFGVPGGLVLCGVLFVLIVNMYAALDVQPAAQWIVRGALIGLFGLLGGGLMLVSIHTSFSGIVLAMGIVGIARCIEPHPADEHEYDDMHDDQHLDHEHDHEPHWQPGPEYPVPSA